MTKEYGNAYSELNDPIDQLSRFEAQAKAKELEDKGVTDTSFMYERDEDGNLTGYFVQKIWWSKYKNAKNTFFKS